MLPIEILFDFERVLLLTANTIPTIITTATSSNPPTAIPAIPPILIGPLPPLACPSGLAISGRAVCIMSMLAHRL